MSIQRHNHLLNSDFKKEILGKKTIKLKTCYKREKKGNSHLLRDRLVNGAIKGTKVKIWFLWPMGQRIRKKGLGVQQWGKYQWRHIQKNVGPQRTPE